jgi:hypothetical protein
MQKAFFGNNEMTFGLPIRFRFFQAIRPNLAN